MHYLAYHAEKKKPKLLRLPEELDVVKKANAESDKKDPFEKVMGKFFGEASTQVKELVGKVEALMADNKELYTYYCGTKEMCLATIFIEFARDFETTIKANQEREERMAKAAEKKKRNKVKSKSAKTSIKKKKMFNENGEEEEEEEEEESSAEEIIEEIIEV